MTHSPKDGDRLVVFLRRHRPEAPPASPALEDKILASLETVAPPRRSGSRSPLRLVPPVLAAGVLFAWLGYQRAVVAPRQEAIAKLETFLETSWSGTVEDSTESSWTTSFNIANLEDLSQTPFVRKQSL